MNPQLVSDQQRAGYTERRLSEFAGRCREHGLSITPQRLAIIGALLASDQHPSADAIYEIVRQEHPYISLATVHRTLEILCDVGEARKVTLLHDSARYDGNVLPHHHVVCVRCRRIKDVEIPNVEQLLGGRTALGEFEVVGTSVQILAVCGDCSRQERSSCQS